MLTLIELIGMLAAISVDIKNLDGERDFGRTGQSCADNCPDTYRPLPSP
jgi:hypothetical protein